MKPARALAWAVFAQLSFLAASGVYLYFNYRPSTAGAWFEAPEGADSAVRAAQVVRGLHHLDSWLVIGTALALGIVVLVEHRPRAAEAVHSWAIAGACVAGSLTGALLPWDQLGLFAVTVGTNMSGFRPLFDNEARFVLLGGSEIDVATIQRWLIVHVLLGLLAIGGVVAFLVKMRRPASGVE